MGKKKALGHISQVDSNALHKQIKHTAHYLPTDQTCFRHCILCEVCKKKKLEQIVSPTHPSHNPNIKKKMLLMFEDTET